jgi:hypothetical protein
MKRSRTGELAFRPNHPQPGDRRAELYQNAAPPLQKEPEWIRAWWDRHSRHTILRFYELGKMVRPSLARRSSRLAAYPVQRLVDRLLLTRGWPPKGRPGETPGGGQGRRC